MTYIAVRQLLPRLHNLCHVNSRVTMLRYSLNMLNFESNVINLPFVVCLTVRCVIAILQHTQRKNVMPF